MHIWKLITYSYFPRKSSLYQQMACNVLYAWKKFVLKQITITEGLRKVCTAGICCVAVGINIIAQVSKSWELFVLFAHRSWKNRANQNKCI